MATTARDGMVAEAGAIARLAWPLVLARVGFMVMGAIDTLMVARLDPQALAGIALGVTWSFGFMIFGRGIILGLDPVIAQAHGAGDEPAFERAMAHGLILCSLWSVPLMGVHLLAEPGLRALAQPVGALPLAGGYTYAVLWSAWPLLVEALLRGSIQARGRTRAVLWIAVVGNVVNVPANLLFMYGAGGWEGLGPVGVGWSTTLVRCAMLAVAVVVAWEDAVAAVRGLARASWARLVALHGVALPVGAQIALEVGGFSVAGLLMGWVGEDALAAHTVALQLSSLSFMVPMGIGVAGSVRVGNLLGAGKAWDLAAWTAVALGGLVMVLPATVFAVAPSALANGFLPEGPAIAAVVASVLPVAAVFQVSDGVQVAAFGVLRGAGDTRWPMWANVVGFYVLGLPGGAVLAFGFELGAVGVWMGLTISLTVVAAILLVRLRHVVAVGGFRRAL